MEKQRRDAVEDDAKQMEKLAHKRSLLMKKVRAVCCYASLCAARKNHCERKMVKKWHPSKETRFALAFLLHQYKELLLSFQTLLHPL